MSQSEVLSVGSLQVDNAFQHEFLELEDTLSSLQASIVSKNKRFEEELRNLATPSVLLQNPQEIQLEVPQVEQHIGVDNTIDHEEDVKQKVESKREKFHSNLEVLKRLTEKHAETSTIQKMKQEFQLELDSEKKENKILKKQLERIKKENNELRTKLLQQTEAENTNHSTLNSMQNTLSTLLHEYEQTNTLSTSLVRDKYSLQAQYNDLKSEFIKYKQHSTSSNHYTSQIKLSYEQQNLKLSQDIANLTSQLNDCKLSVFRLQEKRKRDVEILLREVAKISVLENRNHRIIKQNQKLKQFILQIYPNAPPFPEDALIENYGQTLISSTLKDDFDRDLTKYLNEDEIKFLFNLRDDHHHHHNSNDNNDDDSSSNSILNITSPSINREDELDNWLLQLRSTATTSGDHDIGHHSTTTSSPKPLLFSAVEVEGGTSSHFDRTTPIIHQSPFLPNGIMPFGSSSPPSSSSLISTSNIFNRPLSSITARNDEGDVGGDRINQFTPFSSIYNFENSNNNNNADRNIFNDFEINKRNGNNNDDNDDSNIFNVHSRNNEIYNMTIETNRHNFFEDNKNIKSDDNNDNHNSTQLENSQSNDINDTFNLGVNNEVKKEDNNNDTETRHSLRPPSISIFSPSFASSSPLIPIISSQQNAPQSPSSPAPFLTPLRTSKLPPINHYNNDRYIFEASDEIDTFIGKLINSKIEENNSALQGKVARSDIDTTDTSNFLEVLPANFRRITKGIYLFGTKKVHVSLLPPVQEGFDPIPVVRISGSFTNFIKFVKKFGRSECSKVNSVVNDMPQSAPPPKINPGVSGRKATSSSSSSSSPAVKKPSSRLRK